MHNVITIACTLQALLPKFELTLKYILVYHKCLFSALQPYFRDNRSITYKDGLKHSL